MIFNPLQSTVGSEVPLSPDALRVCIEASTFELSGFCFYNGPEIVLHLHIKEKCDLK